MPADPLAGLDLGAPSTKSKPKPSTPSETTTTSTAASGPLAGLDLSAPPSASSAPSGGVAKPPTYDDASALGLAGDVAYRAANTGTLGALDYGLAGVHALERATGYDPNATDLATIHRQNEEWQAAHPYLALGADVAGYGLGAGKLGVGAKIAGKLGGGLLARAAGSAAENALASGISEEAATTGQASVGDLLKHAALAGGVGSVAGAIPVKGVLKGAPSPTENLGTATENAFRPLEQTHYDPSPILTQFDNVGSTLAPKQTAGISDSLSGQISKTSKAIADAQALGKPITADDLTNFQVDINKAARGGRDIGVAKTYQDALDNVMATHTPMAGSVLTNPADVSSVSDAALAAARRENVSSDIDSWIAQAKRNPSKTSEAIGNALDNKPQFYPGTVGDLLRQAATGPGIWGKAKSAAIGAGIEAAIGAGTSYISGGNPLVGAMLEAPSGLLMGHYMGKPGAGNLVGKLQQARHANAYGVTPPLSSFGRGIPIPGPLQTYGPNLRGAGVGVSNLLSQ